MTHNSKEQDYESDLADHGVRKYDYDIGRFTSTDVLFEKYYGWSPYQYSANNPINMLDWNGLEPGDPFKTRLAAAKDFGTIYNVNSIVEGFEYGTSIYSYKEDGTIIYSYSIPERGTPRSSNNKVPVPEGTKKVASAHTHGDYDSGTINDAFSDDDLYNAKYPEEVKDLTNIPQGMPVFGIFPDGTIWFYNPNKKGNPKCVGTNMPSDKNDPNKKNDNIANPDNPDKNIEVNDEKK